MLVHKKIIAVFLLVICSMIHICAYANTYKDENIVYGQKGDVWIFYIEHGTNIKTNFTMNTPENGGPILDDKVGVWIPMISMCANLGYEYKDESDNIIISNGLRLIEIPKNEQAVYTNNEKNEFEYNIINNYLYFPYKYLDTLFDLGVEWDEENKYITLIERASTPVSDSELQFRDEATTLYVSLKNNELHLALNTDEIIFEDAQPFIDENDRTMVPIRAVAEMLNCEVQWDETAREVSLSKDNTDVLIKIDDRNMIVNNKTVEMDTTAVILNDRTYIPLRFAGEALGLNVFWGYAG